MLNISPLGYLSPVGSSIQNHICMLPCGGLGKNDKRYWSVSDLEPYASYIINGTGIDTMFKGFIFNGLCAQDYSYIYPLFAGLGKPADSFDWMQWIECLFTPNQNLHALFQTSQSSRLDVWISIPYPDPSQHHFGNVNGSLLNFTSNDDRFTAVAWWIDQFLSRWQKENSLSIKLDLRGFHWQREMVDPYDEELVKKINQYIKSKNLYSMWLPNYGSYGVANWSAMGFDIAVIYSNYCGNTNCGYDWVNYASDFSKNFHTGLQIVFGKGFIYNDTHLLDYLNLGLPETNGYMNESIIIYQFPNQTIKEIYDTRFVDYICLYTFTKGLYTKIPYPGIQY